MRDPIDNPENNMAERVCENAIQDARSILAEEMTELMWSAAKDAVHTNNPGGAWDGWFQDNAEHLIEHVYDELFYQAKKLWEE